MNESETRNEDNNLSSTGSTPEVETTSTEVASSAALDVVPTPEPIVVAETMTTEPVVEAPSADVGTEAPIKEEVKEVTPVPVPTPTQEEEGITFGGIATAVKQKWTQQYTYIAMALVVAVVVLAALLCVMERQGRLETGMFDDINRLIDAQTAVAKVNDGKVSRYDLNVSVSQMTSGFTAQGADIESEEIKTEIQTRAMDMLVNTELLKQEAAARDIAITDEAVADRLETLTTDVGGEAALKERMAEFNVSEKILRRDIKNELTIQALLDGVFEEKNIEVSESEIVEFYKQAAGEGVELPDLESVRPQIEQQLRSTKEQEVVTAYIEELRGKAEIEILI